MVSGRCKPTPERYCVYCGQKLERKVFPNGRHEDMAIFLKRKYCDRICMRKAYLKQGLQERHTVSNARATARSMNELIMKKIACEICGKTGRLDVHHKDKNTSNNSVENLMVVCRSCHNRIHRPKPICKVPGCEDIVKGYGYCHKHYQRFKKYGSPYVVKRNTRHTKYDADVTQNIDCNKEVS